jgi:nucleolar protein 56
MYLYTNIIGSFVFDESFNIVEEVICKNLDDYKNKDKCEAELKKKYKSLKSPDNEELKAILICLKNKKYHFKFYELNQELTKSDVRDSVDESALIIQAVKSAEEVDKSINMLVKRLREWYDHHNPEYSRSESDNKTFVSNILKENKEELLKRLNIEKIDSLGADLKKPDIDSIKGLATQISQLYYLIDKLTDYISNIMESYCPNIKAVCGISVGSRLIEHAGSLKRLCLLPASTIQILGAEKALFRHMKTGARPPRHGLIVNHSLISKASNQMHGKIARTLADKISIAAKIDYFKGSFIGDKLRKELEEKFSKND